MTDKVNIEEMDLDSMSLKDLDSLLSEAEGTPKQIPEAEPAQDPTPTEPKPVKTSDVQEEPEPEATPEEPAGKTEEPKEEDPPELEPQFRGKTLDEVLEMQRNANKKISQLSNENYHLNRKVDDLSKKPDPVVAPEPDPAAALLSQYDDEQIAAMRAVAKQELDDRQAKTEAQLKADREAAMTEHDELYDTVKALNPALAEQALAAMRVDQVSTYHRKGWMKQFIAEYNQGAPEVRPTTPIKPVVPKKRPVSISGGGANSRPASQLSGKPIDGMTAEEYEKHMNAQGVKF